MYNNNENIFIETLHNVLLALYLCDRLFLPIMLTNSGYTCLFHKRFFTLYLGNKKKNAVTLLHIAQRTYEFLVKTEEKNKSKKVAPRKKVALKLLHHRLGHRSTRSFMDGDTAFFFRILKLV